MITAILAVSTDPADARARRKKALNPRPAAAAYTPPYAAIVVDSNSGATLHAANPDALRHPASLTKIMTLYLLFERLDSGRIKLTTPLAVSEHAAAQAPSKLGIRPGQTITVEDAIKALVTKSANDVAVIVAEALGGDEETFAKLMTRKARALGMSKTIYMNASGLPHDEQITTAREQALLGRAIQERFPKYYGYFSTQRFTFRGKSMRNHNRLLGSVEGVDGIKTGYTRASGFNLITSMRRGGRQIVAVVLGGRSGNARDARMRELVRDYITVAAVRRTAPMIAEIGEKPVSATQQAAAKPAQASAPVAMRADTSATTAAIPVPRPAPGSTDPMRPNVVKTLTVRPGAVQTASLAPLTVPETSAPTAAEPTAAEPTATAAKEPSAPPAAAKPDAAFTVAAANVAEPPAAKKTVAAQAATPAPRSGWIIQVGAFGDEAEAKQRLSAVQSSAARLLGTASPFTETFLKGDKTYYRARFAGLDKNKAEAACKYLKRNDVACFTVKN